MPEKRRPNLQLEALGLGPGRRPAPMGEGAIPDGQPDTSIEPTQTPLAADNSLPLPPAPPRPAPRRGLKHQQKLDSLMDRLTTGLPRALELLPAPRTHSLTLSLPTQVHQTLQSYAGRRQMPSLVRESMLRLATESSFHHAVAIRKALKETHETLTVFRKNARSLSGEGVRGLTVPLSTEECQTLVNLSEQFDLSETQLLEALAFEMGRSAQASEK